MPSVFNRLDQAWHDFTSTPHLNGSVPDALALAGNSTGWGQARRWLRETDPESVDRVLVCLCRHATGGDTTPAQIAMTILMPGMVRLADQLKSLRHVDVPETVVAGMWESIVTYPVDRTPHHVAPNLVRATRRRVLATASTGVEPVSLDALGEVPADHALNPGDELLRLLSSLVDHGSLTATDASLIARWRIGGETTSDLARSLGRNQRTASWHRCRAEARLLAAA